MLPIAGVTNMRPGVSATVPEKHCSGKVMVCGHSEVRSGVPLNLGHAVCIDTRAYAGGWLTCLDVESGHYWQANERGGVREGEL